MFIVKTCGKCGVEWPIDEKARKQDKKIIPLKKCNCGASDNHIVNKKII